MNHDVTAILDDARQLDLLAGGRRPTDPAAALLHDLRGALEPGGSGVRRRRRVWSRAVAVTLVATAIPLAGVTGAAAASHPGDVLYGVRRTVIGRTADDPWTARQLVERAREVLPPPGVTAASSTQVRQAELFLDQARASERSLKQADAQDLSRRIGHVEHRIRLAGKLNRNGRIKPAGRVPSRPRQAARRRRSR